MHLLTDINTRKMTKLIEIFFTSTKPLSLSLSLNVTKISFVLREKDPKKIAENSKQKN